MCIESERLEGRERIAQRVVRGMSILDMLSLLHQSRITMRGIREGTGVGVGRGVGRGVDTMTRGGVIGKLIRGLRLWMKMGGGEGSTGGKVVVQR